ncbi:MAG: lipid droplet-associated protein, partial [Actinomycetes bacterium]
MSTLPLPVRVAVGLAVTAVEQACKLPEQLSELPVTAASRAVQTAMRVQQRVTELAIKGDQVCALFQPVEDTPPWARFDEDDEPPAP